MPQRKKRSRTAEANQGAKQQAAQDSASKPAPPLPAAHPPKRNVAMLALSSFLFVMWILFLAYVALFG